MNNAALGGNRSRSTWFGTSTHRPARRSRGGERRHQSVACRGDHRATGPAGRPRAALESVEGLTPYASFAGCAAASTQHRRYRAVENFRHPFARPNIAAFWRGGTCRFDSPPVHVPTGRRPLPHPRRRRLRDHGGDRYLARAVRPVSRGGVSRNGIGRSSTVRSWRGVDGTQKQHFFPKVKHRFTFVFVMLGFTFTRSNDLGAAVDTFRLMLYGGMVMKLVNGSLGLTSDRIVIVVAAVVYATMLPMLWFWSNHRHRPYTEI